MNKWSVTICQTDPALILFRTYLVKLIISFFSKINDRIYLENKVILAFVKP